MSVSVGPEGCLRHRCSSTSLRISATRGIPPSSATLEHRSFERNSQVELGDFTLDLQRRLRTLYAQ